LTSAAQS